MESPKISMKGPAISATRLAKFHNTSVIGCHAPLEILFRREPAMISGDDGIVFSIPRRSRKDA